MSLIETKAKYDTVMRHVDDMERAILKLVLIGASPADIQQEVERYASLSRQVEAKRQALIAKHPQFDGVLAKPLWTEIHQLAD